MSDYLALCKQFRAKAGIAGNGPTTTLLQTGEYLRIIDWIRDTWTKIQNDPHDWKWMWREYSQSITAGISDYTLTNVQKIHKKTFTVYKTSIGATDRQYLNYVDWNTYQQTYPTSTNVPGRPSIVTRKPNGDLKVWPTPDDTYTIDFEYQKTPQILADNTDTPELPAEFHEIILYLALIDHGGFEEANEVLQFAIGQYADYFRKLLWSQELKTDEDFTVRAV